MANFKHATCTIGNCDAPHKARGMCNPHYQQALKDKDFTPTRWGTNPIVVETDRSESFWNFVKKELRLN